MSEEGADPDCRSGSILNYRAATALAGNLVTYEASGAAAITDALCELLRSEHAIGSEVRELLVMALERGRSGYRPSGTSDSHVVRLSVDELGPDAAINRAAQVRFNYLQAVEEYNVLVDSGVKKGLALAQAGTPHGLNEAAMRKHALKFHEEFQASLSQPFNTLHDIVMQIGFSRTIGNQIDEDYYYCFRSQFVWAEAAKSTRISRS